ncbi:MAG: hypothetical protein KKF33_15105 [Alphaproteobacteria bacterium]|nr:hypothetical protein [Alphaproteobacteria bacterium]
MYNAIKTGLAEMLGLSKDALHIHVGLAVFVVAAMVFRRSLLLPWLVVFAFELANELIDISHWNHGAFAFEVGDSLKDLINTMLWPTVAVIVLRYARSQSSARLNNQPEDAP